MVYIGRQRKPLELQKGDLTKARRKELENQSEVLKSCGALDESPPEWLTPRAVIVWEELMPKLRPLTSICDLDRDNIGGYCQARSQYEIATKQLEQDELIIEGKENPLIKIQTTFAKEMREFAGKCGLTIDSRLKIAENHLSNLNETIVDEFGDI